MYVITMKKILLSFLLLFGMSTATFAYDNTYAVIVGVADYMYDGYAPDLPYSLNNSAAFYNFLTSKKGGSVPSSNIVYLTDSKATKENVIYQAKALFSKAKKNDRVIFYFGGHGGAGGFAPHDFNGYYDSMLLYGDIKAIFRNAKCGTKLLFADACHSGGIKYDDSQKDINLKTMKNYTSTDNINIAVMVASKDEEFSFQVSDLKMGIFTYYLIEGLGGAANQDGNKYVTIQELYYYVYHKVIDKTKTLGVTQTPQLFGKFDLRLIVAKVK